MEFLGSSNTLKGSYMSINYLPGFNNLIPTNQICNCTRLKKIWDLTLQDQINSVLTIKSPLTQDLYGYLRHCCIFYLFCIGDIIKQCPRRIWRA